jgi:hypothetical protein
VFQDFLVKRDLLLRKRDLLTISLNVCQDSDLLIKIEQLNTELERKDRQIDERKSELRSSTCGSLL